MAAILNYKNRLDGMIAKTEKNKAELKRDIINGKEAIYQYYTH